MKTNKFIAMIFALALGLSAGSYQAQHPVSQSNTANGSVRSGDEIELSKLVAQVHVARRSGFALMPSSSYVKVSGPVFSITPAAAGANLSVVGSGTVGRLTKWTGLASSNSVIGNSSIYEDKFGKVGIGTDSPSSKLTVMGLIETTLGGIKFPDGTTQTTSTAGALFEVAHDLTLQGNGTLASPLGVAVPFNLSGSSADPVFSASNSDTSMGRAIAVRGNSPAGIGVVGDSISGAGVVGESTSGFGVGGRSTTDTGVFGKSTSGIGVRGESTSGVGVFGRSLFGTAMKAEGGTNNSGDGSDGVAAFGGSGTVGVGGVAVDAHGGDGGSTDGTGNGGSGVNAFGGFGSGVGNSGGNGILAFNGIGDNGATNGRAGSFFGDVLITGQLQVTSGIKMFHIDHPLDPENKYLNHAAIESSEVLNVYSGNTTTDQNGDAIVSLPDWFEALNKDFRYQLTVIGTFAQAIVASEVKDNRFVIKSNSPNVKVSWQVTGVRSDATAHKYKFEIEEEKPERERGFYLNPDAYGQSEEKGIQYARHPEMMRKLKQQRLEAEQMRNGRQPDQH